MLKSLTGTTFRKTCGAKIVAWEIDIIFIHISTPLKSAFSLFYYLCKLFSVYLVCQHLQSGQLHFHSVTLSELPRAKIRLNQGFQAVCFFFENTAKKVTFKSNLVLAGRPRI